MKVQRTVLVRNLVRMGVAVGIGFAVVPAYGDGGAVIHQETKSDLRITLFAAPAPPSVGPLDLSALVQSTDGRPILDCTVQFTLLEGVSGHEQAHHMHGHDSGPRSHLATREAATNKLLYHALVQAHAPGTPTLHSTVDCGQRHAMLMTPLPILKETPGWLQHGWLFLLPVLVVGLFGLHQFIQKD